MSFTPTDPTKAEVRIVNTDPLNPQFDFYIPRGSKGDPGGITLGTSLGTTDLNTLLTPGVYRQSGAPSVGLNYPVLDLGVLVVHQSSTVPWVMQEYTPTATTATPRARLFYRRTYVTGVWSAWMIYRSDRLDQTAGRALYTWDDTNNREQLIWGDTGSRDITATFLDPSKWAGGQLKIRRVGSEVELRALALDNVTGVIGSVPVLTGQLPLGFRNQHTLSAIAVNVTTISRVQMDFTATQATIFNVVDGGVSTFTAKWQTADAWPTSLPGTADGTIPNL